MPVSFPSNLPARSKLTKRKSSPQMAHLPAAEDALKRLQAETAAELDALLPAILDKVFPGVL